MSILEIVSGVLAALVLITFLGSLLGRHLRSVARRYPLAGGDDE